MNCTYCGSEVVLKSVSPGSHDKPKYKTYYTRDGKKIFIQYWTCPKASFWNHRHTEFWREVEEEVTPSKEK